MNNWVVVTEIFFNGIKVSRCNRDKNELDNVERNQLVQTLFLQLHAKGDMRRGEIYTKIETLLKENFNIIFSDRSVMRICTEQPSECYSKEYEEYEQIGNF